MTATTTSAPARTSPPVRQNKKKTPLSRYFLHVFLALTAFVWAFPVLWAVVNAFRDYAYTSANGYVSWGGFTLKNFTDAWEQANFTQHFLNSIYVTVPAVLLTLFLASGVAFVIARFSWRFNIVMLGLFTAANLLPQQSLLIPLYRIDRKSVV